MTRRIDSRKQRKETEKTDHPSVLYVSQSDFEWLLNYLADDEEEDEV